MGEVAQAGGLRHPLGRESVGPAATWEEVVTAGGTPEEAGEAEVVAAEEEEEETKGAAPATWSR